MTVSSSGSASPSIEIRDVWLSNIDEEFATIRSLLRDYPYVAMDTEFPGVVATPLGQFKSKEDFNYQQVSCNVNMLRLIQVGFTLLNEQGELPESKLVWQFNFSFSLGSDMYSNESIDMLRTAGINFERLQNDGIPMELFGELLTTSGMLVDTNIVWLTFSSGYDFGYLLRSVISKDLPKEESQFFQFHRLLFPSSYDIKFLLRTTACQNAKLKGGLQEVADQLGVTRVGAQHQAGSDSYLTAAVFFKIRQQFFSDNWDEISLATRGHLYGLGKTLTLSNSSKSAS